MAFLMHINGQGIRYERLQIDLENGCDIKYLQITTPQGNKDRVVPFGQKSVAFTYDEEGMEHASVEGEPHYACRYTPKEIGEYVAEAFGDDGVLASETITAMGG